jgi:hypothetical protein
VEKDLRNLTKGEVKAFHGLLRGPLATLSEVRGYMKEFDALSSQIRKANFYGESGQVLKEAYRLLLAVHLTLSTEEQEEE